MSRITPFLQHEHYHIYNRGNSKQEIFLQHSDYTRFLDTMYLANTTKQFNMRDALSGVTDVHEVKKPDQLVRVEAFCLMPNHFHLVLSPIIEGGLSKFMLKLGTSYSMYFNTRYERTGALFEGRFKSKHATTDEYLKYLFAYIHLNPVVQKEKNTETESITYPPDAFRTAANYQYSSLKNYLSPRPDLGDVDTEFYNTYFNSAADIEEELLEWINFDDSQTIP